MFWTRKDSMKVKYSIFRGYKQKNKVCLVYLECQLQQDRYGSRIFKWKWQKTDEGIYLERRKQQTTYRWWF